MFFQNSHFFAVIISEQLLFESETSTDHQPLFNSNLFRAVTFRNSYLFGRETVKKKIRDTFSKQVLLHIINFLRKAIYWKKLIIQKSNTLYYLLFSKSSFFRAAAFSKDAAFYSIYVFRRPAFLQLTFSEELIFHSYGSFPRLHQ